MAIHFNTDKPTARVIDRLDRPINGRATDAQSSQNPDASAQVVTQSTDQAALGRAQELLSAASPRPPTGNPLGSHEEARSIIARMKEQFQRQPELALSSLTGGLGARVSALLEAAPLTT